METLVSFHCNLDTGITRNVCACHSCCVVTACEKLCCNQMIKNLMEHAKIGRIWPFYIEICFMVLCMVTGHNGHKPKRPQPKRPQTEGPQTETATNRNGHRPKQPQTGTATNQNGHRPERPQTGRPQTETASDRKGHKPKRPHQLSPTTSVVTRIYMMEKVP